MVTLVIFSRWSRFTSERDFYRYAMRHLRDAFPTLPHRSQFNRLDAQGCYFDEHDRDHAPALGALLAGGVAESVRVGYRVRRRRWSPSEYQRY